MNNECRGCNGRASGYKDIYLHIQIWKGNGGRQRWTTDHLYINAPLYVFDVYNIDTFLIHEKYPYAFANTRIDSKIKVWETTKNKTRNEKKIWTCFRCLLSISIHFFLACILFFFCVCSFECEQIKNGMKRVSFSMKPSERPITDANKKIIIIIQTFNYAHKCTYREKELRRM